MCKGKNSPQFDAAVGLARIKYRLMKSKDYNPSKKVRDHLISFGDLCDAMEIGDKEINEAFLHAILKEKTK